MAAMRRCLSSFLSPSNHFFKSSVIARPSSHLIQSRGFKFDECKVDDCTKTEDEILKIKNEFEEAKRNFLNIPAALKEMPLMNPEGIYINKNVKLDDLQVYGFDYDYTLSHYSENLQFLIYDFAKKHLVYELKYPESCLQFEYDPKFPVRGLYYDKQKGCLLKLDFFGSIEPDGCFYGRKKLSLDNIKEFYGTRHIGRDLQRGLVGLMDFFCFSEACLIADIIQHFVESKLDFDASYVYEDINQAIQYAHKSGLVHKQILAQPHKFLIKNVKMLEFLQKLKEKGKKLFLLTNSPFYFVDGGMNYMLEDYIEKGSSWRDLFDVVIAKANKPTFYKNTDHPFRCYDTEKDTLQFTAVDKLVPNKVYYHGSLKSFLEITKWKGPEVIYFGDHLFSDLRGSSKAGWRTAAIIHELEDEIKIQNAEAYRVQQAKLHIIQELLGKIHAQIITTQSQTYLSLLQELNSERQKCRSEIRNLFNTCFGATFLTDTGKESSFAYHIHQYADIYMSKPENFMSYPAEAWLHPPFDIKIMPHHVKVPASLFKGN